MNHRGDPRPDTTVGVLTVPSKDSACISVYFDSCIPQRYTVYPHAKPPGDPNYCKRLRISENKRLKGGRGRTVGETFCLRSKKIGEDWWLVPTAWSVLDLRIHNAHPSGSLECKETTEVTGCLIQPLPPIPSEWATGTPAVRVGNGVLETVVQRDWPLDVISRGFSQVLNK